MFCFIVSVECYDFKGENWYVVVEMNFCCCCVGVVVLDGFVYVVGGFNGLLCVCIVDCYDFGKD